MKSVVVRRDEDGGGGGGGSKKTSMDTLLVTCGSGGALFVAEKKGPALSLTQPCLQKGPCKER